MHKPLFFALFVATATIHTEGNHQKDFIPIVNKKDEHGRTLLMLAAENGNKELVIMNLSLGADRSLKDNEEQTAADIARRYGHLDIACLLDVDTKNKHGEIPLMTAARKGDNQAVQRNLYYGADWTVKNPRGKTAATIARENGHLDIVYVLNCHRFFNERGRY